jgi:hypothetical protein
MSNFGKCARVGLKEETSTSRIGMHATYFSLIILEDFAVIP